MASQPMAQPAGADQQQGQQASQQPPDAGDVLEPFRQLAKLGMALGQKFPEAAQEMAQMLKAIQGAMVKVAGNQQRVPDRQTPPQA